ncbi:MAG: iron-sulfur cluster carrier protein ApbC [Gammaproteobacteria bacterium]|nr:iron-sulfur cluster carrier protein ApbC [Gammaproteobacteria bacterium]
MSSPEEAMRLAVAAFVPPDMQQPLAGAGALRSCTQQGDVLHVEIDVGFPIAGYETQFTDALRQHLAASAAGGKRVEVALRPAIAAHSVQRGLTPFKGVKNVVAVASGKGGVGKSTVAVNLALAWHAAGARVGLLDADIYGPSLPLMLGLIGQHPTSPDGKRIRPLQAHGISAMSVGFLVDPREAVVWRGPMVTSALTQLLNETEWGELDYLVVDMPPGTGDIQLTLAQKVPVAGAVIVTTPQDIALADARKGVAMFEKVAVPVLGVVENMSLHVCSRCGHVEHIFGSGGGARMAQEYQLELLGELPLDAQVREEADGGRPTVVAAPDSERAAAYVRMARRAAAALARRGRDRSALFPKIVVEQS